MKTINFFDQATFYGGLYALLLASFNDWNWYYFGIGILLYIVNRIINIRMLRNIIKREEKIK